MSWQHPSLTHRARKRNLTCLLIVNANWSSYPQGRLHLRVLPSWLYSLRLLLLKATNMSHRSHWSRVKRSSLAKTALSLNSFRTLRLSIRLAKSKDCTQASST